MWELTGLDFNKQGIIYQENYMKLSVSLNCEIRRPWDINSDFLIGWGVWVGGGWVQIWFYSEHGCFEVT